MDRALDYPFYVIGLDIGGTKIAGGLLLYKTPGIIPDIIYKESIPAEAKKGDKVFIGNICKLAESLISKANEINSSYEVLTIGMGSAGRINKITGVVEVATDNFPGYPGNNICKILSEHCGIPTFALNDVQSHTLGEARWGAGRGCDDFLLLAIGTGVGGAIVCGGELLKGSHGFAGELGHIQVSLGSDIKCPCGKVGHLEGVASGSGIERNYLNKTGKSLGGAEISKLSEQGDKDAVEVISLAGRALGRSIAMLFSVFDCEKIILSGSVIKAGSVWKKSLFEGIDDEVLPELKSSLFFTEASLGDEAALFGACENALDGIEIQNKFQVATEKRKKIKDVIINEL